MKNISEIVIGWLRENGYDGLTDGEECGCTTEEFNLCCGPIDNCYPAYNHGPGADSEGDNIGFLMFTEKKRLD